MILFSDKLQREACRTCGAHGLHDSGEKCRQFQLPSGDYCCPGDGPHDEDEEGYFLYLSPEGEAAQNTAIDEMIDYYKARGEI